MIFCLLNLFYVSEKMFKWHRTVVLIKTDSKIINYK